MMSFRRCCPALLALVALGAPLTAADRAARFIPPSAILPPPLVDADYYENGVFDPDKVELGRLLFFDKILSGNRNISCGTCHHALTATGDGLSLPSGEGARGLGVTRDTGSDLDAIHERVPRNAPAIFNLGLRAFEVMFHDGRLAVDPSQPSGFFSPAGDDLPVGVLDNVLAAQAMFPVTSGTEMAGQPGENSIADAAAAGDLAGPDGVWEQLAERLRAIPEYVDRFLAVFPELGGAADITYAHAANAIAAFEASAWRADDTRFDRFLRGDRSALSANERQGMRLFYGRADCASCHSGALMTDLDFHAVAMPQIGPGKGDGPMTLEDFGRARVTGEPSDMLAFRTPALRNVALTGPWGHAGSYDSLRAAVEHHLDPIEGLYGYDPLQAVLPSRDDLDVLDFVVMGDAEAMGRIADACELEPNPLSAEEVDRLMDFLYALTDLRSIDLRIDVPRRVPSGLPIFE